MRENRLPTSMSLRGSESEPGREGGIFIPQTGLDPVQQFLLVS
jgi:hypothetical protein